MEQKNGISVVVPVYKGSEFLIELSARLSHCLSSITPTYEIIFIEDAGGDDALKTIKELQQLNPHILYRSHRKNMGQHVSILHGLRISSGEWIVVMDGDLQDAPEDIIRLYADRSENNKIILASRKNKQFSFLRKLFSTLLNFILYVISLKKYSASSGNFCLLHRDVAERIKRIPANRFYFPAAIRNSGFAIRMQNVDHGKRPAGNSSYRLSSLLKLACTALKAARYIPDSKGKPVKSAV